VYTLPGYIDMPWWGFGHDYNAEREISSMLKAIENTFIDKQKTSRDVLMIGHSAGGSVIQKFVHKHQDNGFNGWNIVGQVLMGSAVERKYISINEDGSSNVDFRAPIFSLNGELDGIMRQSRQAE